MLYDNLYMPVTSLPKAPVKSGGLCSIRFFKHEDVLTWPAVDPVTGVCLAAVTLKPGAFQYSAELIDPTRSFEELQKESNAGKFFEMVVKGLLHGSNAANSLATKTMVFHQWGMIIGDRNGISWLIGNQDAGARFIRDYKSGDIRTSRKTELAWRWNHYLGAQVYEAQAFEIILGGLLITAGCIQFIQRFQVGAAGSPMNQGDLLYINGLLANKKVLVVVDGMVLPVDDLSGDVDWSLSIQRRVEKAPASNTINFVGSVVNEEIIEIYAYS
jgi:hypothetical protein